MRIASTNAPGAVARQAKIGLGVKTPFRGCVDLSHRDRLDETLADALHAVHAVAICARRPAVRVLLSQLALDVGGSRRDRHAETPLPLRIGRSGRMTRNTKFIARFTQHWSMGLPVARMARGAPARHNRRVKVTGGGFARPCKGRGDADGDGYYEWQARHVSSSLGDRRNPPNGSWCGSWQEEH